VKKHPVNKNPRQNRVGADGEIVATPQRGLFYGNRGGQIHDPGTQMLHPTRRWASRQWICCVLQFKDRRRPIMGPGYTELFFLDEVTALAAGHRPCFECRRADALAFAHAWNGDGTRARAPDMDKILHSQRIDGSEKRTTKQAWGALPIGAMVRQNGIIFAKTSNGPLHWSFDGYVPPSDQTLNTNGATVDCLTPKAILTTLENGYTPHWHPSANMD